MIQELIKSYEKSMAHSGLALLYPAYVMGEKFRSNGIPHHVTIKFFDKPGVTADDAHEYASKQNIEHLNPNNITVTPKMFTNRFGEPVHVLALDGPEVQNLKSVNKQGSHLGQPVSYDYTPHISVDKDVHDFVKSMGRPVKASELGIEFDPPELRHGHRVLATYAKISKSMWSGIVPNELDPSELKKSGFKQTAATTAALLSMLGSPQMASTPEASQGMAQMQPAPEKIQKDKMLRAIASVESSGGIDVEHAPLDSPLHAGESAYGKYGLTPLVIRETIDKHPDLRKKYGQANQMRGQDLKNFMKQNPNLEHEVASRHFDRLHKIFGNSPSKIGYAWLNGVTGTLRAERKNVDFNKHWHAKKVKNAYEKVKKIK